jgi:hypothetical protein
MAREELLRQQADAVHVEQGAIRIKQDGLGFFHAATVFDTSTVIDHPFGVL